MVTALGVLGCFAPPPPNHGPSANLDHLTVRACGIVHSLRANSGWERSLQGKKCAFRAQSGTRKTVKALNTATTSQQCGLVHTYQKKVALKKLEKLLPVRL